MRKKLLYYIMKHDWVWSVPLAFIGFVSFALIGQFLLTEAPTPENPNPDPYMGFYSPEFLHAAIYAAFLMVFANMIVQLGLTFNFKTVHTFMYGSAKNDFKNLPGWAKILLSLFLYVFFFVAFVVIWATLV